MRGRKGGKEDEECRSGGRGMKKGHAGRKKKDSSRLVPNKPFIACRGWQYDIIAINQAMVRLFYLEGREVEQYRVRTCRTFIRWIKRQLVFHLLG